MSTKREILLADLWKTWLVMVEGRREKSWGGRSIWVFLARIAWGVSDSRVPNSIAQTTDLEIYWSFICDMRFNKRCMGSSGLIDKRTPGQCSAAAPAV